MSRFRSSGDQLDDLVQVTHRGNDATARERVAIRIFSDLVEARTTWCSARVAAFHLRLLEEARLAACRSIENLRRALRVSSESRGGMNGTAGSSLSFGQQQMDRLPTTRYPETLLEEINDDLFEEDFGILPEQVPVWVVVQQPMSRTPNRMRR